MVKIIGSGMYTGYLPKAPGTYASFAALLIYLIPGFENPSLMIFIISLLILVGVRIALIFEKKYGTDPKEFTLDEFIGMWITLLFLPKKIFYIIPAFIIWRALDILKPFPINKIELIKNGWGIILDDVLAGFYSFMIIQFSIHLIHYFT